MDIKRKGCKLINLLTDEKIIGKIIKRQDNIYRKRKERNPSMGKINERGAGRKPALSKEQLNEIKKRRNGGESVTALAKEYGISRQALSGHLNKKESEEEFICETIRKWARLNQRFRDVNVRDYTMRMDFMCEDECCTEILIDFKEQKIAIQNETDDLLHRAFGIKAKPTWNDFEEFLESRCFPRTREGISLILEDLGLDFYDPLSIIEKTRGRMAEDAQWIKIWYLDSEAV